MARQHSESVEGEELRNVMTTDKELLLPKEYLPMESHVDPRMACGDKRAVYEKVNRLNQLRRISSGEWVLIK